MPKNCNGEGNVMGVMLLRVMGTKFRFRIISHYMFILSNTAGHPVNNHFNKQCSQRLVPLYFNSAFLV